MVNVAIADLLQTKRPDGKTWDALVEVLDEHILTPADIATIQRQLSTWPKELPRPASKTWLKSARMTGTSLLLRQHAQLLSLCLDVKEDEQLYHHYITEICGSPRLRLRDGSPAVNLWRQPRGVMTLQGGGQVTLGAGQPGLADTGGTMTVEWDKPLHVGKLPPMADRRGFFMVDAERAVFHVIPAPTYRTNLYIEVEIKIDQKIPPLAREYRGTSKRVLTQTEQDQCQRQQAQLARGGCYIFAERVSEAIDELVRYRDEVLARLT